LTIAFPCYGGRGPEVCFSYLSDWFAGFQLPRPKGCVARVDQDSLWPNGCQRVAQGKVVSKYRSVIATSKQWPNWIAFVTRSDNAPSATSRPTQLRWRLRSRLLQSDFHGALASRSRACTRRRLSRAGRRVTRESNSVMRSATLVRRCTIPQASATLTNSAASRLRGPQLW
jgi:hypothetical protein